MAKLWTTNEKIEFLTFSSQPTIIIIIPKGKKGHTTPHICVPITYPRRNIPSHQDQQARYRFQHGVLESFHSEIQGPVFLSVGPDAKLDMLKNF